MGRDKRNEADREYWTKMLRPTMQTEAWRALSPVAQALYPWLKFEWRGPGANNNGAIRLSVRQAAERLGVSVNTAAQAFHNLQAKGFLVVREGARLGFHGRAKSPAYEITELDMPGRSAEKRARKLYLEWKPGHDFDVTKGAGNGAKGRPAKTESRLKNCDGAVSKTVTKCETLSQKM